jgi:hypothetical protein
MGLLAVKVPCTAIRMYLTHQAAPLAEGGRLVPDRNRKTPFLSQNTFIFNFCSM